MARQQLSLVPTVKTTVRFPQELYRRLKIRAIEESRPVAILIADSVEVYLSNSETKRDAGPRKK
jgi:predicted DNA-binding protein